MSPGSKRQSPHSSSRTIPRMPSTISFSQGDVVLVPFPFTDLAPPTSDIRHLTSDIRHSRFSREALAHRNHPGRTGGFSPRARRAFLSREADYRLDLQKTRRLLRRDDGFA